MNNNTPSFLLFDTVGCHEFDIDGKPYWVNNNNITELPGKFSNLK